jgi:hypothetical protein
MSGKPGQKPTKPLTIPATARPGDNMLDLLDGRSLAARYLRRNLGELYADQGGVEQLSHGERSGFLRIANLETFIATREAHLLKTSFKVDDEFMRVQLQAVGMLLQLYRTFGIKRRPKDVPDLQTYLRQKAAEKAAQQEPTEKESTDV